MGSSYSKGQVIALGSTFSIVPILAVWLRFRARNLTRAKYGLDDMSILPAAVIPSTPGRAHTITDIFQVFALATAVTLIIGTLSPKSLDTIV